MFIFNSFALILTSLILDSSLKLDAFAILALYSSILVSLSSQPLKMPIFMSAAIRASPGIGFLLFRTSHKSCVALSMMSVGVITGSVRYLVSKRLFGQLLSS